MSELNKGFMIVNGQIIGATGEKVYSTSPIGTVLSYAGQTIPNGYLLCDGASYLVKDYPDLYAVIGNTYGGDSTNFNVPNLIDKFIQGSTTSGTEKEAGLPNITGSIGNISDSHAIFYASKTNGAFTASQKAKLAGGGTVTGEWYASASFDASLSNAIYGNSDTVQPPALTMVYIIKAFHTNEGTDIGLSDEVSNYVDNKIANVVGSNISKTVIQFTNSTNWSIPNTNLETFYVVKNGWCFLHVVAHCNKVANDENSIVFNGLPKPPFQVYGKFLGNTSDVEPCDLTITPDGKMLLRGGTVGKDYSFTYTYLLV